MYEGSLMMIKKNEVLSKIGSIFLSQIISVALTIALFSGLLLVSGINSLPGILD